MKGGFFPDRWRTWRMVLAALLVAGALSSLLVADRLSLSTAFGSGALFFAACAQLRAARRAGVTLDDRGLTVRTFGWLGANGTWRWSDLLAIELFTDDDVKNGAEQLGVRTRDGDVIRLGPARSQGALLERLRDILPER